MDVTNQGARTALLLTRLLRAGILVVCLGVAGAAWLAGATTLMGLALVIAAEETWETSVVVSALHHQLHGADQPRVRTV